MREEHPDMKRQELTELMELVSRKALMKLVAMLACFLFVLFVVVGSSQAQKKEISLETHLVKVIGEIRSSLFEAMETAGEQDPLTISFAENWVHL
jgi:hypothetical protein